MKRFAIRVILHILFIMLLSIGSCLLFQKQLWFSTVHHTINNLWYTPIPYAIQANNFIETADRRTSIQ